MGWQRIELDSAQGDSNSLRRARFRPHTFRREHRPVQVGDGDPASIQRDSERGVRSA